MRTDRALVDRFRAGDETAFEVLHDRHEGRVLAICVGVLGSTEDAKDASQEVFARVASALLEAPPAELRPWLARVTRNAAIDVARARRPRTEELPEDQPSPAPGPASAAERHDQLEELMTGLQQLPEPQRTALVMRELGGFNYAEIGRALDVDETAVTGLIARARVGLRTHERAVELTCNSVRERLAVEVDGRRRPAEVRRHLRGCSDCRDFRTGMKADRRAIRGLIPGGGLGLLQLYALTRVPRAGATFGAMIKAAVGGPAAKLTAACVVGLCAAGGVAELGVVGPGALSFAPPHAGHSGGDSGSGEANLVDAPATTATQVARVDAGLPASIAAPVEGGAHREDLGNGHVKKNGEGLGQSQGKGHPDRPARPVHPGLGAPGALNRFAGGRGGKGDPNGGGRGQNPAGGRQQLQRPQGQREHPQQQGGRQPQQDRHPPSQQQQRPPEPQQGTQPSGGSGPTGPLTGGEGGRGTDAAPDDGSGSDPSPPAAP